ncbi:MAG: PCYCGC motif-containing (lipo)protein [Candidatus Pristimantibacillus sp.]
MANLDNSNEDRSPFRGVMYALVLAFAFITFLTACSISNQEDQKNGQHQHGSETWETTASFDVQPSFLVDYTKHTGELYDSVHDHMDIMSHIDCYCGCMTGESDGLEAKHDSLLRCYIAELPDDGVTWTNHSTGCGICKMEMEDVIAFSKQGKTLDEIKAAIDQKYKPKQIS